MFKEYGELSTILYKHTKPVGYSIDGDIEHEIGYGNNQTQIITFTALKCIESGKLSQGCGKHGQFLQ